MTNKDILLVDDDPDTILLMSRILAGLAPLRFATSGAEALKRARESAPALILLDAEMPGVSGFQVCQALKADAALADVPVIFVTSHCEPSFEVAGFEIGAADFISKPVTPALVRARVERQLQVRRMTDELRRISTVDALTGVANRRRFDDMLGREWLRAKRAGDAIALLLVDVDHFKLFNDCFGHPAGDACLRSVSQALAAFNRRPGDLVARYGGEEFALLLPDTARSGAEHMAHRVLDAVDALRIPHALSPTAPHLTVSVGIACYDEASACWIDSPADSRNASLGPPQCSSVDLLEAADKALYSAKHAGRARARLLDIADVDTPAAARDVARSRRARRMVALA